mgnify:CR=1 FL=1
MSPWMEALKQAIREKCFAKALDLALSDEGPEEVEFSQARSLLFAEGRVLSAIAMALREEPTRLTTWWEKVREGEALPFFLRACRYFEGSFRCYCPLCRGAEGEHTLRALRWALAVALACVASREGNPEDRLSQAAEWLRQAAALLNPEAEPPSVSPSWTVRDPLLDVLLQLQHQRPHWLLNPIWDLLKYFRTGQWAEEGFRSRTTTFPMVAPGGDGVLAKLRLTRTSAPFAELYPDPRLLLVVRWDEAFNTQLERAWKFVRGETSPSQAVRWSLERYKSERLLWLGLPLSGPSVGAALGVGLKCLLDESIPPPDADCALTGALEEGGRLGSVGGYDAKTLRMDRYARLRLVVPQVDGERACAALPDWSDRLQPASTLEEALPHATRQTEAVKQYLEALIERLDRGVWYRRGQLLGVRRTFTPLRVLVYQPAPERPPREKPSEEKERLKPTDLFAEVQASFYELTEQRERREEVRWQDFTRRLENEKRAVLIGAPGSGKTFGTRFFILTLAERALQHLEQGKPLDELQAPFWVTARQLADARSAESALLDGASPEATEWLRDALQSGRAVIVVDALDELPEARERDFRNRSIELDAFPGTVLVTCRTLQWNDRRDWLGWKRRPDHPAELAPLNPREQRAIARRFFEDDPPAAQTLERTLSRNFALRHACQTPLMLTFVCLLHSEAALRKDTTYAELYVQVLRKLLAGQWRNVQVNIAPSRVREAQVLQALDAIAWNLFRDAPHRNLFTLDMWQKAAPASFPQPEQLLEQLEQVGLVIPAGYDRRDDPQWSFAHRSLLEFFAARHLSRQPQKEWLAEIRKHFWFQPEWWEVLTFLAGLVEDATPLLRALESEPDDIFGSLFTLRARVAGFGRVLPGEAQRIAHEAVGRYFEAVGRYFSDIPRDFTLPALRFLGEHALEPLLQRLEDEKGWVRWAACEALGAIGSERGVEPLIRRLEDEHPWVRRAACRALGKIGSERGVEPLIRRLEDEDWRVREAACEALGEIGSERAVEPLIQRLEDENEWVRRAACRALGAIGSERGVEPLIRRLEDKHLLVREAACEALGEIGSERAVEPLIRRLEDEDGSVRRAACEALGEIGSERAVEPLLQRLEDEDASVRWAACEALGAIGSERVVEPLIRRLEDGYWRVRVAACWALGEIGSERGVEPLLRRLEAEDWSVRVAACRALGEIGSERAVEPLIQRLEDERSWVRRAACEALGAIGSERGVEPLIQRLEDEDWRVREAACRALGKIGSERAVEPLIRRLEDEHPWVRRAACWALGAIGSERGVEPLIQRLEDEKGWVREAAWNALWHISQKHKLPILPGGF